MDKNDIILIFPYHCDMDLKSCTVLLMTLAFASSTLVEVTISGGSGAGFYQLSIQGSGHESTYTLSKPMDSIFSSGVTIGETQSSGGYKNEPVPSDLLEDIHNRIHVDYENDAIFHIGEDHKVTGFMGDLSLNPESSSKNEGICNHRIFGDPSKLNLRREKRNIATDVGNFFKNLINKNKTLEIEPELWIILDYGNSKAFNFDRKAILEYLAIYMHAASIPYKKIKEFRTSFKVTNVTITTSEDQNPFNLTAHKHDTPIGHVHLYWPGISLDADNWYWYALNGNIVYNETAPSSEWNPDIAMILMSERMASNLSGTWTTTGGFATIGGACNKNRNWPLQISVVYNTLGVPDTHSTRVASHEIAHLLGSGHDGDEGIMKDCPREPGYLMSPKVTPENRYVFSNCSVQAMLNHIRGNGTCLVKRGRKEIINLSNKPLPGSLYPDMKSFCMKRYPGFPDNRPTDGKTPEELCYWMTCQLMDAMEKAYIDKRDTRDPAPDGLPCGNSKVCFEGKCLDKKKIPKL